MLQAHVKIPDDAWEYQIRKTLNDAAYNGLDYVPYCSTMPVQPKCDDAKFIWVSVVRPTALRLGHAHDAGASCRSVELTPFCRGRRAPSEHGWFEHAGVGPPRPAAHASSR